MMRQLVIAVALIGLSLAVPIPEDLKEPLQDLIPADSNPLPELPKISPPEISAEASDHLSVNSGLSASFSSNFSAGLSTNGQGINGQALGASKEVVVDVLKLPLKVSAETKAVGAGIPAGAAIAGTAAGSAIATPVILKAVALPGIAAAKTAALVTIPNILVQNLQTIPEFVTNNLKTVPEFLAHIPLKSKLEDSAQGLTELVVIPSEVQMQEDEEKLSNVGSLAINATKQHLTGAVTAVKAGAVALKAGALGLAAKPFIVAKKVATVAGRIIMKPIAIIAGAHLKALGTGLTLAGKLIGGTGAGIAKAGTAVKFAGLGGIGVGASAVAWGFDKSTLNVHHSQDAEFGVVDEQIHS